MTLNAPKDTRERILAVGYQLISRQGYHATGLKQILDEAGVPKGSFYHYFNSKEHLAIEVIQHYQALELERWKRDFLTPPDAERLQQIRSGLATVIDEYRRCPEGQFGCLLASLSGELAYATPFLRSAISRANDRIRAEITADLALAQQQGSVRADIDPGALASLFWCAWQGATLQMKTSRTVTPLQDVLDLLINGFYSTTPPSVPKDAHLS